ncbi:hypothetical protein ACROYT_G030791 [Oculina patagonica]
MVPNESAPLYYEVSPLTKLLLRVLAGITGLTVVITLIISFVKAADDSMMYLIAVNMLSIVQIVRTAHVQLHVSFGCSD